jgi:zinc/manganese transport system substrate-binding protein
MGDIHPTGNPHYMLDPRRVEKVVVGIGKRLAELDKAHKTDYLENARRFLSALRKARTGWEARLKSKRGEEIIAYHKSFPYLADWLGLRVIEHIEPRPGIPPNPRHVAHVIEMAKQHKVRVILQESWYPKKTSELIAQKSGARVAEIPGMPDLRRGQGYLAFMNDVVTRLAKAFGV